MFDVCLQLFHPFNFLGNLFNDVFILDFLINAENDEDLPAEFFSKGFKTCFHSFGNRVVAEICLCSYRFDLNAKCAFTNPTEIINIACVVKFGVAFFKFHIWKCLCEIAFNDGLFSDKTVKCSVDGKVMNVVDAVL